MTLAALLAYLFSAVCFIYYERSLSSKHPERDRKLRFGERLAVSLLILGATLQAGDIVVNASQGRMPFSTPRSAMTGICFAWVVIGVLFILRMRVSLLGIAVAPLAIIASLIIFVSVDPPMAAARHEKMLEGVGVALHAILGYAGYGAFLSAALGSGLFLLQDRELRLKRMGALFDHLPPLERSSEIMRIGVKSGLYLFITAIISAVVFLRKSVPVSALAEDSNILALAALCLYAASLFALGSKIGWSRHRVVFMAFMLGAIVLAIHTLLIFGVSFHSFARS